MTLRALRICLCALALALVRPPLGAAQDDEDELGLDEDDQAADEPDEAEASEGDAAEEAGDDEVAAEEVAEEEGHEHATPTRTMSARAFFGGGFGTRSLRRPLTGGGQRLPEVFFAAADLGIGVRVWPEDAFSLDVLIRYQTSLGLVIEERPLFAFVNKVDVRSEHAEVSVAPRFQLGSSASGTRFGIPIGISMRNFWPVDHHLLTPRYTLVGPHARAELDVALGEAVRVRLGPEIQLFAIVGSDLLDLGVSSPGIALGGEVGLQFRFAEHFAFDLEFRQSWARASTSSEPSFLDTERFLTARLAGEM